MTGETKIPLGPFTVTLPAWWRHGAGVVALAAIGFYVWANYASPVLHSDEVFISEIEHTQMEESMRHFFEEADGEWNIDTDEATGLVRGHARHFESDHCTAVLWHEPSGDVVQFVLHPSRTFDQAQLDLGDGLFADAAVAGVSQDGDRCAGAECYDSGYCAEFWPQGYHPGRFETTKEQDESDECIVWVYRRFEDCCESVQLVDICQQHFGGVDWLCCRH